MPTYPSDIQDKLDALQALTGADRRPAEMCVIYWPAPASTKIYASAMYTKLPWWPDLADAIETYFGDPIDITLTLIPDGTPFIDLPRAASISDDSINLTFDDSDDAFSTLLMTYGEGIRTEVFCYWPAVDLLLSMWRGMLHQAKELNSTQVKITATAGWRAGQMLVPKRPHATSCPFIFGALLATQDEIDYHSGCPYNVHIGGSIGVPGFTDCPRRVKADCVARLDTEVFWPGFETRPDAILNNQTKGPNLLARAIGNESNLNDPIRVIFGERYIKAANLLAFRNETDTNHPEDGFFAGLFEFGEGPMLALWEFRMMGQLVSAEHFQLRLGALGQPPTDWSPDVNSYSGTAHGYGRIQGESDNATASDYSGTVRALGHNEVRVYSDPSTFAKGYTTNRAWCLLEMIANARWGYGLDYPRSDIQSFIDAAAWCDEYVTLTDSNGNTFSGVRSTFNAEVTARAIQQQVKDLCTAGRLGIPFEFEGKDVVVPLKAENVDDPAIPVFTDEGPNRNIIYDGAKSSLSWSVISDETLTNQWTVNFDEAANGGVDTQFIFGDQAQQLRAGRAWGDRSKRVVNKSQSGFGINSAQEAARFGNSLLYLGPLDSGGIVNPFSVKFTTWYSEAFNVQNYKIIKVVNAKLQSRMAAYFAARGLDPYPDADYTVFRVMKYSRKGDLRVDIEAQQYATLDIVLSEQGCEQCDLTTLHPVLTDPFTRPDDEELGTAPGGALWEPHPDAGVWRIQDNEAVTNLYDGTLGGDPGDGGGIVFIESGLSDGAVSVQIKNAAAGGNLNTANYGIAFRGVDAFNYLYVTWSRNAGFLRLFTVIAGAADGGGASGELGATLNDNDVITVTFCGDQIMGYINDVPQWTSPSTNSAHLTGRKVGLQAGGGIVTPNELHRFDNFTVLECDLDTFSAPTNFGADVNAVTGVVHLHWGPPTRHPELVTGYTLYESDGVTVVQATSYDFDADVTLAPGTYTYKVNATDGVTVSSFASVTFTVPTAPVTGADLFVIDDLTLENVLDDLTLEQVTA